MPYYYNKLNQKIAYNFIKGKSPGIIFIHGLNSDMKGNKALSIQKYAKKRGFSFLRFDCRGHGNSYGEFKNFTISDWKQDLIEIIDNVVKGPQILIGSSMGGWLMLLAAKSRNSRIAGLIGLAAAPDFTKDLFEELSQNKKKEILKKGIVSIKKSDHKYTFTKKFFKEGKKNLVLKNKIFFNKPIVLIHGLKDKTVAPEIPKKILKRITSKKAQIRYLKDSGHNLSEKQDLETINNSIENILNLI